MKIPAALHYFRCRICASILITGFKAGNYEHCNGCRSYMRFLFSEPVETPEQRECAVEVARHGRVFRWSPSLHPFVNTPSTQTELKPLATPEEIEAAKATREAIWAEEEARMEAAYRAAEEQRK